MTDVHQCVLPVLVEQDVLGPVSHPGANVFLADRGTQEDHRRPAN
jgi:hypothetical protein